MEEKDVNSIASAVTTALSKLTADEARAKRDAATKDDKSGSVANTSVPNDMFKCPDCGGEVAAGIQYCQHCGCALEWEE